jgi:hypothetical protein
MSVLYGKDRLSCPISKVKGVNSSKILDVVTLGDVFKEIRTDDPQQIFAAEQVHAAYNTPQYKSLKEERPAFLMGKFDKRVDSACQIYSPCLVFDIDKIQDKIFVAWMLYELQKCPYVFAAFPSVGGQGLRVFFWSDATIETHQAYYEAACQYLSEYLNIQTDRQIRELLKAENREDDGTIERIDTSTSNLSRLWLYAAVKEELFYLNLHSDIFSIENKQQITDSKPLVSNDLHESEKISQLVEMAKNRCKTLGRNNFIFFLACFLNEHGIYSETIHSTCADFVETDFTQREIRQTVESALKRSQFGKLLDAPVSHSVKNRDLIPPSVSNTNNGQKKHLTQLLKTQQRILMAASQAVVQSPAIISRFDAKNNDYVGIFRKGTINVIQGKMGTHKSRLAELLLSLLLKTEASPTDFLDFIRWGTYAFVCAYIDTERNQKEAFPMTIQNIREKAGYAPTHSVENFYPFSIKEFSRDERMNAVKECLAYIQLQTSQPMFVVLDVITDCVKSFNNDRDSLELYDHLGNMCDEFEATFLILIHENPNSEKARGHTGTEAGHKADVVMQIGYDAEGDGKDLMKLRFLKHRNAARPDPIYLKYSKEAKGLVLADDNEVREQLENKRKNFDVAFFKEAIEGILEQPMELQKVVVRIFFTIPKPVLAIW